MFTVTFVLYERDGVDRATALEHWRTEHASLVREVPGVTHYVQQHAIAAATDDIPFLGVASLSFADQDAFTVAAGSPQFAAAITDVANFADETKLPTAFTEDVVIVG